MKQTFEFVLVEETYQALRTSDPNVEHQFEEGASVYGFQAYYSPYEDGEALLANLPPGRYVIVRGSTKVGKDGMTLPKTWQTIGPFEVKAPDVQATVEKV